MNRKPMFALNLAIFVVSLGGAVVTLVGVVICIAWRKTKESM